MEYEIREVKLPQSMWDAVDRFRNNLSCDDLIHAALIFVITSNAALTFNREDFRMREEVYERLCQQIDKEFGEIHETTSE